MKQIRHLFWDFDGTLFDSYPELFSSFITIHSTPSSFNKIIVP